MAPSPLPPPSSAVTKMFLFLSLTMCRRSNLLTGEGGGANHATARKLFLL